MARRPMPTAADAPAPAALGLFDRIVMTWRAPRRAARVEIDAADEARLLFYAFAAAIFGLIGAVGAQALNPAPAIAADFQQWVVTKTVVGLFVQPLGYYGAAGIMGLLCRGAGGTGGWRDTRAAVFWTALAAAPAGAMLAVVGGALTAGGAGLWPAAVGKAAGSAVWAALLAPALAEAHGFRSAWPVFGVFALITLAVVAGSLL
jgi:hypothetical protein